jgi:hypothetical protein
MIQRPAAAAPGMNGMIGAQGPAVGMRRPTRTDVDSSDGPSLMTRRDGSIQYTSSARLSSRVVTTQSSLDPPTPLKTRAESMRGSRIDAHA